MKNIDTLIIILIVMAATLYSCNSDYDRRLPGNITAEIDQETDAIRWKIYSMTYSERSGEKLFGKYCVVCHGISGQGDGFNSFNLDPRPRDLSDSSYINTVSDSRLKEIIAQGGKGTGKSVLMPAYRHTLSNGEISDLVNYTRYLSKKPIE